MRSPTTGRVTFVRPVEPTARGERRDRWLFPALGAAGLAVASTFGTVTGSVGWPDAGTLGLVALALGWLAGSVWLLPRRTERPALVIVCYVGLLVLVILLAIRSPAFFAFGWIGYAYAFALFAGPAILIAVTAAAIGQYAALVTGGVPTEALVLILPIGIFVPIVVAGWIGVVEDGRRRRITSALTEANRRLETALTENTGLQELLLARARERGKLEERQRLARDIHDTLAQGLTGIVTQARAVGRSAAEPERWRHHLGRVEELARESLTEARRSVQALRPGPLEGTHLLSAITSMTQRWSAEHDLPATVKLTGEPGPLPTALDVALFRAAQEALTNIAKHAHAGRVGLTLSYLDDVVLLDVRDDGVGFDPDAGPSSGFGLTAMRQRLSELGGTLAVESSTGDGTAISISVPRAPAEGGS